MTTGSQDSASYSHYQNVPVQNRLVSPTGLRNHARTKEQTVGNILITVGLCLLLLISASYGYTFHEEWLYGEQRIVGAAAIDDWAIRPLPPKLLSVPNLPKSTPTPVSPATLDARNSLAALSQPTANASPPRSPTPQVAVPIRIKIPKINVNSNIVEVAARRDGTWGTAAYAVAYEKGSGLLGQADNMVLSGHNNFEGEVFRRLSELTLGDMIYVYSKDREYRYKVVETATIPWVGASQADRRRHLQYLLPSTEPKLTLVSCWPYWFYTHRIYVVAKPVL